LLDNETDDINSDGIQVYLRLPPGDSMLGFLIVPEANSGLRVRAAGGSAADPASVTGSWEHTASGYRIDARIAPAGWGDLLIGDILGFDVVVNEMRAGRERRAGQLVWSADGGWVWLRGDRHDPASLGQLELGAP
jgi:hypothetical protein